MEKEHGEGKAIKCVLIRRFPLWTTEAQSPWETNRVEHALELSCLKGKEAGVFIFPLLCTLG